MPELRRVLLTLVAVLTFEFAGLPSAHAVEPAALQWLTLPEPCNSVALIQMRKLVNSPLGKKEKWADEVRRSYAEGLLSAPPWVQEVVRATAVGSSTRGMPTTFSIYSMSQASVIGDIAKHELARSERIAGSFAVLSRRNVYYVQLASGLLGTVQPANRQTVSHWVHSHADDKGTELSPYLKRAIEAPGEAQIVIAVDLNDMLEPQQIRKWLSSTPQLSSVQNPDAVASQIASLVGARLSVAVTDTIAGRLRLDFAAPVGPNADALKAAILQWLDDAGARIEVLGGAKATVSGNSLTFDAPLDELGLRRLLSLIQSPHVPMGPNEAADAGPPRPNAVASAAYYNSVCDLLNSLLRKNRGTDNYDKTALWHEKFARKIGDLPMVGVDPDLLKWGHQVSDRLLALAGSLRGVPVEVDQLQRSIRVDATTSYRWYANSAESGPLYFPSWVQEQNNLGDVRAQQADVIVKNREQRDAIWNILRDDTAETARRMEYKYQIKLKLPQ
jgi:hypothetical protein